jgi:hypothetical protein
MDKREYLNQQEANPMSCITVSSTALSSVACAGQHHVYAHFKKQEKKTWSTEIGIPAMMKNARNKKKIYNYAPEQNKMAADIREAFQLLEEDDATLHAEAQMNGKGYQPYVLRPIPGVRC